VTALALAVASAGGCAIALAALFDRAVGEPPTSRHPVAWFGRLVAPVDRDWPRPRLVGAVATVSLALLAAGVAAGAVLAAGAAGAGVGRAVGSIGLGQGVVVPRTVALAAATVAAGLVLAVSTSLRMLVDVAREVTAATASDLAAARRDLRALAGRDAATLSPGEVRSAAVESAAENFADGLVAPLAGFVVPVVAWLLVEPAAGGGGGNWSPATVAAVPTPAVPLALGAAGAAWVKAVNTCDSMLGYRTKPVGWAAARLDDATVYLPARASAGLLALAAGDPGAVARARSLARRPASPNSGWPMATLAAALGVRLAKPGHYDLDAGPSLPSVADAERGVAVVERAGWLAIGLAIALVGLAVAVPGPVDLPTVAPPPAAIGRATGADSWLATGSASRLATGSASRLATGSASRLATGADSWLATGSEVATWS
jgi:adenosylcobinamide-phosphate synthase